MIALACAVHGLVYVLRLGKKRVVVDVYASGDIVITLHRTDLSLGLLTGGLHSFLVCQVLLKL